MMMMKALDNKEGKHLSRTGTFVEFENRVLGLNQRQTKDHETQVIS
jgi:hypothetical protein